MTLRRTAYGVGLGLLFVALVLVMVRPVWGRFPSDPADPSFVAWTMSWVGHAVAHSPRHILDANIFWPRHAAYAYSDLLLPIAPIYLGFHALTGSWEAAITLTDVTLLVFALAMAYLLARWLTGRTDVALFAAIAFALNGFVLAQISHLQLYSLGFVALTFLLLFRLLDAPSAWRAFALALSFAATLYSALYYGLICAVCIVLVVAVWLFLQRRALNRSAVRALVIAALATAVLIAPAAFAYLHAQDVTGYTRGIDPQWGLRARDLIAPPPGAYLWRSLSHHPVPSDVEHRVFAGFSTYLLGAFGLLALLVRRTGRDRYTALLVAGGALALLLALGPVVAGHKALFWYFHDYVPGFGAIRAVSRFAVVALLAVAMLAAVGLARLTAGLNSRARRTTVIVACAILLAEFASPLRWEGLRHTDATLAVYHELALRQAGAVVELPMADHNSPAGAWARTESPRMLFSTIDWHPRVNGYSGLTPKNYARDAGVLNTFPSGAALARLHELRVSYVIWHTTGSVLAFPLPSLPPNLVGQRYGDSWLIGLP